jgi:hypothetical protein
MNRFTYNATTIPSNAVTMITAAKFDRDLFQETQERVNVEEHRSRTGWELFCDPIGMKNQLVNCQRNKRQDVEN